jgi:hypothetical protein
MILLSSGEIDSSSHLLPSCALKYFLTFILTRDWLSPFIWSTKHPANGVLA